MFAELAIGSRLEMPTASPGQEIVVELYGAGGPITVDLVSEILLPEWWGILLGRGAER
jgi:hypothetical protein